jgi:hypothetical protein
VSAASALSVSEEQDRLRRVLGAYALFDAEVFRRGQDPCRPCPLPTTARAEALWSLGRVGYTQGLNFLASFLLRHCAWDEPTAFALLVRMMHMPLYALGPLYAPALPGVPVVASAFSTVLQRHLPAVAAHFAEVGCEALHFFEWWFSLFLLQLPPAQAAACWDLFFADGWVAVFRVACVLLQHCVDRAALLARDFTGTLAVLKAFANARQHNVAAASESVSSGEGAAPDHAGGGVPAIPASVSASCLASASASAGFGGSHSASAASLGSIDARGDLNPFAEAGQTAGAVAGAGAMGSSDTGSAPPAAESAMSFGSAMSEAGSASGMDLGCSGTEGWTDLGSDLGSDAASTPSAANGRQAAACSPLRSPYAAPSVALASLPQLPAPLAALASLTQRLVSAIAAGAPPGNHTATQAGAAPATTSLDSFLRGGAARPARFLPTDASQLPFRLDPPEDLVARARSFPLARAEVDALLEAGWTAQKEVLLQAVPFAAPLDAEVRVEDPAEAAGSADPEAAVPLAQEAAVADAAARPALVHPLAVSIGRLGNLLTPEEEAVVLAQALENAMI